MSLVDAADVALMLGAYGWVIMKPIRKLYYNLTITAISVLIGGVETLRLIGDSLKPEGGFWAAIGALNDNFGLLGYGIIAIFTMSSVFSALIYKVMPSRRTSRCPRLTTNY